MSYRGGRAQERASRFRITPDGNIENVNDVHIERTLNQPVDFVFEDQEDSEEDSDSEDESVSEYSDDDDDDGVFLLPDPPLPDLHHMYHHHYQTNILVLQEYMQMINFIYQSHQGSSMNLE